MKNTQQEVLLVIATRFSATLWHENNPSFEDCSSENDFLDSSGWQVLLSKSLPEIFDIPDSDNFRILQIKACENYLELDFAESRFQKDAYHTIDPYIF